MVSKGFNGLEWLKIAENLAETAEHGWKLLEMVGMNENYLTWPEWLKITEIGWKQL